VLFRRLPHQPVYFAPDGETAVWAFWFSRWKLYKDAELVPALRRVYNRLLPEAEIAGEERPLANFLVSQGVVSLASEEPQARSYPGWKRSAGFLLRHFAPHEWDRTWRDGIYCFPGDGEGGCWRYHYQAGRSACLGCLWRHWFGRYQPELLPQVESWPDLQLSWPAVPMPAAFRRRDLPVGAVDYAHDGKILRGRVWARPGCGCCPPQRATPQWWLWTHPVAGPLGQVAEHRDVQDGLWRVSVHLGTVPANGARPLRKDARRAALGEALERWATYHPPAQTPDRVRVWRLGQFGSQTVASQRLWIGFAPGGADRLSHGLACGSTLASAVAAGFWELVERDALALWWRDWTRGDGDVQRHPAPAGRYLWSVPAAAGRTFLACFPSAKGGAAWGSAAGPGAPDKALAEARHNFLVHQASAPQAPAQCHTFAEHSAHAWHSPVPRWQELIALPAVGPELSAPDWRDVVQAQRPRFYYRRLPCHWADVLGWSVVRVLSPDLVGLPMDQRHWPVEHPRWGKYAAPSAPHPFG
jgi:hypothetical protein